MKKILIANAKGGVGKTMLATNLAWIASVSGTKTVLIDAHAAVPCHQVFYPSIDEQGKGLIGVNERLALMSLSTSDSLADALMPIEGDFGLAIVDMGPDLGPPHPSCFASADLIVLVSTADPAALLGALKTARGARRANPAAKFGVVVNCALSAGVGEASGKRLIANLTRFLSAEAVFLGAIVFVPAVTASVRKRQVLARESPGHRAAKSMGQIFKALLVATESECKVEILPSLKVTKEAA